MRTSAKPHYAETGGRYAQCTPEIKRLHIEGPQDGGPPGPSSDISVVQSEFAQLIEFGVPADSRSRRIWLRAIEGEAQGKIHWMNRRVEFVIVTMSPK